MTQWPLNLAQIQKMKKRSSPAATIASGWMLLCAAFTLRQPGTGQADTHAMQPTQPLSRTAWRVETGIAAGQDLSHF